MRHSRSGYVMSNCLTAFIGLLIFLADVVNAQTSFYEGKTITVIAGTEPGGTLDMRTKSLTHFLRKHIPDEPTIITEYMPGAGGRKAANYLYRVARPDGLTIGSPVGGFLMLAVLKEPGVEYDINRFTYLGAPDGVAHYVFHTRKDAGLSSVEKLRAASGIRIGAQNVGHTIYVVGRLFAYILGLKVQNSSPAILALRSISRCNVAKSMPGQTLRRRLCVGLLNSSRRDSWIFTAF
jgi:tripartite-type tricarboxylate transporter receptor subunit TctC